MDALKQTTQTNTEKHDMEYSIQKQVKQSLESEVEKAGKVLKQFDKYGKGEMGITPDFVKALPEYKKAKTEFNKAFQVLQKFNQQFVKQFKKEIAKERREKWDGKTLMINNI